MPLCALCVSETTVQNETAKQKMKIKNNGETAKAIRAERIKRGTGEGERWRQRENKQERRRANTGESKGQIKKCSAETESEATVDP